MKDKKELDAHIGKQIKKARELAGYTQEEFADLIQMGTKNVSAIERGLTGVSVLAITRICKALSISSDMLIMDGSNDLDGDKLELFMKRLKCLSDKQLELVLEINNRLFEAFALQDMEHRD